MKATIYNTSGAKAGEITLPEKVFGAKWNPDLVHQVALAMEANARTPIAHTKSRAEVSGTGKKPWKQKGTGSARHGSRRSPIWRKGGVAHGPRNERDYSQKISKAMRALALFSVLSKKFEDGEVLFVDTFGLSVPKTKEAKGLLGTLGSIEHFAPLKTRRNNAALITTFGKEEGVEKSFRNLGNVLVLDVKNINPVEVLRYKYVIISHPEEAIAFLEGRGKNNKKQETVNSKQ